MTNGARTGLSGAPFLARWALFTLGACVIQALSVGDLLRISAVAHMEMPVWKAVLTGYSSVVMLILAYPVIRRLGEMAPPWGGRPWRFAAIHSAGAIVFTVFHVGGLTLIRTVGYALAGERYAAGGFSDYLGELPRDVVVYGLVAGIVWFFLRQDVRRLMAPIPTGEAATFDIRDGARLIRTPVAGIVAVRSAGNYVEVLLADGRRPLMRATMAAVESALGPHGFVRTHRAWIVNRARIEGVTPVGSGDATLALGSSVEAVLSRRYRKGVEASALASPPSAT